MRFVPAAKIIENRTLGRQVECREWLIEEQNARLGHECPGQGNALALATRKVAGLTLAKVGNFERLKDDLCARVSFGPVALC